MVDLNSEYWNNRYLTNDFGWDVGEVTTPLKTYFEQLTNKEIKILIPGAGNSYEAEWLVNNGFENVFVCDYAIQPLLNLQKRCPKIKPQNLLHTNFFELKETNFDLIIEQTFLCAINKSLRLAYFQKMESLIAKNGKVVGLWFKDVTHKDSTKPPFPGSEKEYRGYIAQTNLSIKLLQDAYNSIAPRHPRELFFILQKN